MALAFSTRLELPHGKAALEKLSLAHADDLFAVFQDDPDVWRYFIGPQPRTLDATRAMIEANTKKAESGSSVTLAIIERGNGRAIGSTSVFDYDAQHRGCEIGFTWVAAPLRRTSVNTECKFLLLRHLFEQCGVVRVQLKCDARNERSQAAILRIGAKFEGRLRKHRVLHDGFIRDTMMYSVIDDEWPTVKAKLLEMLGPTATTSQEPIPQPRVGRD